MHIRVTFSSADLSALHDILQRRKIGEAIAGSYRAVPQSAEDEQLALATAIALTEAEPW
jgi:hypothetical protein